MALGYPGSATGAGPAASTARLVTSQFIHSPFYSPASHHLAFHLPPIHQSFYTHTHTSVYAYISPSKRTSDHPPTNPSISTSIQRSSIIHPSVYPPSIHPPTTHLSIHHLSTHHPYTCQSTHCLSTHPLFFYPSILPACPPAFSCPPLSLCLHFKS